MSFVSELKRRKVLRVLAVYASAAFAAFELTGVLIDGLGVPESALRIVTIIAAAGLPVAMGLAWVFDLQGGGLKQTASADTPEGRAELEAAEGLSLLDGRTMLVAGAFIVFGLGLGAGLVLNPPPTPPTGDGPSIAVLPFENRSSDPDALFFVDGIHDELLNQLSRISAIRVISRASVMGYREDPKPIREVAAELGVGTVMTGGVQRAGDAVRISVQLVDAVSDEQIWAETYERSLSPENLFAIQRVVSEAISAGLEAELTPAESAALGVVQTTNQEAYDSYMMGNASFLQDLVIQNTVDLYERAVALDPEYAAAWAALSIAYSAQYQFHEIRTAERLEMAREAYERAFALDDDLPEAWRALGLWHYWGFRRYDEALGALERAEVGLPGDAELLTDKGAIYRRAGRVEEGIHAFRESAILDPRNSSTMSNLALMLAHARNYEESRRYVARTLQLTSGDVQNLAERGSYALWMSGETSDLREELVGMAELDDWNGVVSVERWRVEFFDDRHERAIEVLDSVGYEVLEYQTYFYPTDMLRGLSFRALGEEERAVAHLESARVLLEAALVDQPDEPRVLAAYGRTLAALGETEAGVAAARRAVEVYGPDADSLDGPVYVWELAATLGFLGYSGPAIDQLLIYFDNVGPWSPDGLARHPYFRDVATHPRWVEVEAAAAAWDERMEQAGLR